MLEKMREDVRVERREEKVLEQTVCEELPQRWREQTPFDEHHGRIGEVLSHSQ